MASTYIENLIDRCNRNGARLIPTNVGVEIECSNPRLRDWVRAEIAHVEQELRGALFERLKHRDFRE